jgi:hypothetical protein
LFLNSSFGASIGCMDDEVATPGFCRDCLEAGQGDERRCKVCGRGADPLPEDNPI